MSWIPRFLGICRDQSSTWPHKKTRHLSKRLSRQTWPGQADRGRRPWGRAEAPGGGPRPVPTASRARARDRESQRAHVAGMRYRGGGGRRRRRVHHRNPIDRSDADQSQRLRLGHLRRNAERCGEMHGDARRYEEIQGDAGRCKEIQGGAGRCGEMYRWVLSSTCPHQQGIATAPWHPIHTGHATCCSNL